MSDRVLISMSDGVADVRFNRADKRNALDNAMFQAIAEAGEQLKSEPGLRAVVLSGDGPSFCAGLDFSSFQAMAGGDDGAAPSRSVRARRRGQPRARCRTVASPTSASRCAGCGRSSRSR